jgi:ABC-type transport system substrate-binding protein
MKRTLPSLLALAILLVACSESSVDTTTTTSTAPTTTTTTFPATTTTLDEGPCPAAFCVTYNIQPEAIWSDGVPVTSDDFVYTYEVFADPRNGGSGAIGYELVETVEVVDDKTVIFGFSQTYGSWRTLFDIVLPAHIADPLNLSVTASAFRLDSVEDDRIVLKRNSNFWSPVELTSGSPVGDVDQVDFVFVESVRERLSGLEEGEFDLINPSPLDWIVEDLNEMTAARNAVSAGPFWEHIAFNHDDPLLSQSWVREAIALAIDREAILDETVNNIGPDIGSLDNSIWMTNAAVYSPNYNTVFDPVRSEQILQDRFCVKGDDGIYECQGRRMSFAWSTTIGDEFRVTAAEMIQDSLEQVGIEIEIQLRTPSDLFSSDVFFGGPEVWQMINFSWKAAADPYLGNTTYYCVGEAPSGFGALNVSRYCNDEVEALIRSTERIVDATQRAGVYNDADRLYLEDLAVIPLYQKPSLLAWNEGLSGPVPNMSRSTDMWNLAAWAGQESIVIALETEPAQLDPVALWDEDTAVVMRSLLSGAYSITPTLEFVPVLVESAETYVSES